MYRCKWTGINDCGYIGVKTGYCERPMKNCPRIEERYRDLCRYEYENYLDNQDYRDFVESEE